MEEWAKTEVKEQKMDEECNEVEAKVGGSVKKSNKQSGRKNEEKKSEMSEKWTGMIVVTSER